MKVAFLILTYTIPQFKKLLKLKNIYIHPKFPNEVSEQYKKYVIPEQYHQETKWGDMSIVTATINLLEYAQKCDNYDYYILLSEDAYPLYKIDKLYKILESLNGLSMLELIEQNNEFKKIRQWWFLNNKDATTIISTRDKYKNIFLNKKLDYTPDEHYFLTVLTRENKNYQYVNNMCIFTRWIHNIPMKHPFIFNKLTKIDIKLIKKSGVFFIRKCTPKFTMKKYKNKEKLAILLIGTETNQKIIKENVNTNVYDIIIINPTDNNNSIDISLKNDCIYIINIIWKFYDKVITNLLTEYKDVLNQWKDILITSETYNFNIKDKKIENNKTILYDTNNQRALLLKTG